MFQYLVFLGAAAEFIGAFFYIKATLKGETRPNKVTWFIWALAPLIATCASMTDGVGLSVLPVFVSGFGPLLVFGFSFLNKNSFWKLEKFDYVCGIFSLVALILWAVTKQPLIAITFAILSDAMAGLPTVIKAWKHPETESVGVYITGLFGASTSFFVMESFAVSEIAFPVYLILLYVVMLSAFYGGRFMKQSQRFFQEGIAVGS